MWLGGEIQALWETSAKHFCANQVIDEVCSKAKPVVWSRTFHIFDYAMILTYTTDLVRNIIYFHDKDIH